MLRNVILTKHGVTTITGVESIDVSAEDSLNPIHVDGDDFNSCTDTNLGALTAVVTGKDASQLFALNGLQADLFWTVEGVDGTVNKDNLLENAIAHSPAWTIPEPGEISSPTISFTGRGDDGDTEALTIVDTP